jgi:HlyD family secretion protein
VIGLVIIAMVLAAVFACQVFKPGPKADPYRLAAVEQGDVTKTVSASGTVQALVTVQVGSQLSGLVTQVLVDFNTKVTKGQVLAIIDAKTYASRVDQARADLLAVSAGLNQQRAALMQAEAQRQVDQAAFNRTKTLSDQGFASGQALDQAKAAIRRSDAGVSLANAQIKAQAARVNQSQAALNANLYDLGRTKVVSPIDGVVVDRQIDPGQTVAASFQAPVLFRIAQDLSKLQVKIMVDEADIGEIQQGQAVRFVVDSYPDQTFTGHVTQVRKQPETQQNVVAYAVIAEAENTGDKLLPGMTANADVVIEERKNVLRVPASALRFKPADMQAAPVVSGGGGGGGGGSGGMGGGMGGPPPATNRARSAGANGSGAGGGARILDQLNLTNAQKAKAKPIMDAMATRSAAAGDDRAARAKIRDQAYAALEPLLQPDQKARLIVLRAQFASRRPGAKQAGVVWLLKDKKPWPVVVRVGASDGSVTEIEGALTPGDQVIIGGGPKPLPKLRTPFSAAPTRSRP